MKTCIDCNTTKPLTDFVPKPSYKGGFEHRCRVCRSIKYNKSTPDMLAKKLYNAQVLNSVNRGAIPPDYTKDQLLTWLLAQPAFPDMFKAWVDSGYKIELAPSVDRINDGDSYTLTTIQLLTWTENRQKAAQSKKDCELLTNHRGVIARNKDGSVHKTYQSMSEAMRDMGGKPSASWGISSVCHGVPVRDGKGSMYTPRTYKGFTWEWV